MTKINGRSVTKHAAQPIPFQGSVQGKATSIASQGLDTTEADQWSCSSFSLCTVANTPESIKDAEMSQQSLIHGDWKMVDGRREMGFLYTFAHVLNAESFTGTQTNWNGYKVYDTHYDINTGDISWKVENVWCKGRIVSPGGVVRIVNGTYGNKSFTGTGEFEGAPQMREDGSWVKDCTMKIMTDKHIQGRDGMTWYRGPELPPWFCGVLHFEVKVENSHPASEFYIGLGVANATEAPRPSSTSHMLCYWKSSDLWGSTVHSNRGRMGSAKAIGPKDVWKIDQGDMLRVELDTSEPTNPIARFYKNNSLVSAVMVNVAASLTDVAPYFCIRNSPTKECVGVNAKTWKQAAIGGQLVSRERAEEVIAESNTYSGYTFRLLKPDVCLLYGDMHELLSDQTSCVVMRSNDVEHNNGFLSLDNTSSATTSPLEAIDVLRMHDHVRGEPISYSFHEFTTTDDAKLKCLLTDPIESSAPWFHRRLHGSRNDDRAKAQHEKLLLMFNTTTQLSADSEKMVPRHPRGAYLVRPSVERRHEDEDNDSRVNWFYLCSKDLKIIIRSDEERVSGAYQLIECTVTGSSVSPHYEKMGQNNITISIHVSKGARWVIKDTSQKLSKICESTEALKAQLVLCD